MAAARATGGWRPDRWARVRPGPAPAVPVPGPGECHLWPVPVFGAGTDETGWLALLDPAERDRTAAYRSEPARRTFITSRSVQRTIAACYLGGAPRAVRVERDCRRCGPADHGRPRLPGVRGLDLSVTHTTGWVVVAVVGRGAVGVDLEADDESAHDVEGLAERVLGPAERAALSDLAGRARTAWFYRCWTRKEAAAKLTGHGLGVSLSSLQVHGDVVEIDHPPVDWPTAPIHLADAPAPLGHAAALASTVPLASIRMFSVSTPDD